MTWMGFQTSPIRLQFSSPTAPWTGDVLNFVPLAISPFSDTYEGRSSERASGPLLYAGH
jgi:hypothetical protein